MDWEPEGFYERLRVAGETFAEVDAEDGRFLECALESSTFSGGSLVRGTWRGSSLRGVRLVGVTLARSSFTDVAWDDCVLAGCDLSGAYLQQVTVRGGGWDTVNLRGARLEKVVFEDCRLLDLDLGAARLSDVRFPGCRFERLDLTKAELTRVDLRGAALSIDRGYDRLRGAVIEPGQLIDLAPALAAYLGIAVRAVGEETEGGRSR
jgi:uncharacterized protein YjbI with pentapeptide repeats